MESAGCELVGGVARSGTDGATVFACSTGIWLRERVEVETGRVVWRISVRSGIHYIGEVYVHWDIQLRPVVRAFPTHPSIVQLLDHHQSPTNTSVRVVPHNSSLL
jgi:hypothetical protein